ncbi:MFS transporter [Solibacillus sp. FSL R7-0682]|uniref:MFS transporter n=1 Tax=Solibacillus sp. FSL R7-0682 TaxID=2921690 RepID=UPI0030F52600
MNDQLKHKKATYHLYTFLVSKIIGSLGSHVYAFGISMYILSLTGSSLSFATNILLSYLPRIIISPFAGLLSDRFPRKWLVLGGQAGVILSVSILLIYTYTFELSLIAIYCVTIFNSIFSTFSSVAFTSSIANLVNEERLQKAMSFNQLSMSISGIGGPIVGGMLFGFVSMEIFLLTFIIAAIVTLTLESTMNFKLYQKETSTPATNSTEKESMLESLKAGFTYVKDKRVIRSILWTALWLNLFFTSVNIGFGFILLTILKLDPRLIGITEAGGAIGILITSIYFASRSNVKYPLVVVKRSTLMTSFLVISLAFPLFFDFSSTVNFIYYFIVMVLFGGFGVITNTPIGVMLQVSIDEEYRGRVFGIVEMMAMSMMPVGTLLFGVLYDVLPAQWILIVSGCILIGIVFTLLRPSVLKMAHPELEEKTLEPVLEK